MISVGYYYAMASSWNNNDDEDEEDEQGKHRKIQQSNDNITIATASNTKSMVCCVKKTWNSAKDSFNLLLDQNYGHITVAFCALSDFKQSMLLLPLRAFL